MSGRSAGYRSRPLFPRTRRSQALRHRASLLIGHLRRTARKADYAASVRIARVQVGTSGYQQFYRVHASLIEGLHDGGSPVGDVNGVDGRSGVEQERNVRSSSEKGWAEKPLSPFDGRIVGPDNQPGEEIGFGSYRTTVQRGLTRDRSAPVSACPTPGRMDRGPKR